jgi:hypothetical protein
MGATARCAWEQLPNVHGSNCLQEAREAPELINMYGTGIALYAQILTYMAQAVLRRRDLDAAQVGGKGA